MTPRPIYRRERTPVTIEWKAAGASEPVWAFWRREKSLVPTGFGTPLLSTRSLDTVPRIGSSSSLEEVQ
jgi:hypothetical protein